MPTYSRNTILMATDQQRSVLNTLHASGINAVAYSPYGHRPPGNGLLSLIGFNGELPEPLTGHYLLGNGYRAFNPVLMRFNSPDTWSPFGDGGLNAYMYCAGDPVNRADPTGHMFKLPAVSSLIADTRTLAATRNVATKTPIKMAPISEVPEIPKKAATSSAQPVLATTLSAKKSGAIQRSASNALPRSDDMSFRKALDEAVEGSRSITIHSSDPGPATTPPSHQPQKPRPFRTRNKTSIGNQRDFADIKVADARSTFMADQTTQIRKS
ncbi:RHS repeat-associated core domain-containing protein [Pseudomonas vancouverensis]|uniref:RHS repeat-associated core domain-containing protein n=1 Tax=Pseudomonas vancouverensis TaxID=95300 RepID=A0A1H2PI02_PSEVA|nr:RHS repeat-associated core domain-containing protein [Pseudomonas vancouverensis]KAB0497475.1 RHS repeat-associated core domain-containing protein [Pseudomonas vancouverensis]TDB66202.1 RHS repeat-associated core domain-containing protein [Pseudomonas vancouverensis]SDV16626.1 RHS repeat-associated core domain-containing protein [Pseudomonas vancouverensis]